MDEAETTEVTKTGINDIVPAYGKGLRPDLNDPTNPAKDFSQSFRKNDNVAARLGNGVLDVDLDSPETRALAAEVLPPTATFGHSGAVTHYMYRADPATALDFKDPTDGEVFLELRGKWQRGTLQHSIIPPSIHPDTGERLEWVSNRDLAEIAPETLTFHVYELAAFGLIARHWPSKGHEPAKSLSGALIRAGYSGDRASEIVGAIAEAGGDGDVTDRKKIAPYSARDFEDGNPIQGWPSLKAFMEPDVVDAAARWLTGEELATIHIQDGKLHEQIHQAERALVEASDIPVFQFGERLVHPKEGEDGPPLIVPYTPATLRGTLTKAATWKRWTKTDGWKPANAPEDVARALVEAGTWTAPILRGFVESPVITPQGRIIRQPGYDPETKLIAAFRPEDFPSVDDNPTHADAEAALAVLREATHDFPFVGGEGSENEAVGLAGILTALFRRTMPAAPLHGFSAPSPGTGKTTLVDLASIVATGRASSPFSPGWSEEELEKRIGAALAKGDPVLNLDNAERPLGGDVLNQIITQSSVAIRILGQTKKPDLPTNCAVFATGNGLRVVGDMTRRTLLARLDAGMERPEKREFGRDLYKWGADNRGRLVWAALTIAKAYMAAGEPRVEADTLVGFTDWSRMVQRPLVWAGAGDAAKAVERAQANDPQTEQLRTFLVALHQYAGGEALTAKEMAAAPEHSELGAVVREVTGGASMAQRLGKSFLPKRVDRVISLEDGTATLREGWPDSSKAKTYFVEIEDRSEF